MPERIKGLQTQFLEFWNRFETKQKRIIISVAAVVILALGILGFIVSRPQYENLITVTTQSDAADIKNLLTEEGYDFKISDDTLKIDINSNQKADALLLLAENKVPKTGYSYDLSEVTASNGLMPPTEAERKLREKVFKEQQIIAMLEANEYVSSAQVEISIPETTYLVLSDDEETHVSVQLTLSEELPAGVGENLAGLVAYMVGNKTTNLVIILDNQGTLIFGGGMSQDSTMSQATSLLTAREELELSFSNKVRNLLLASEVADTVSVATTLEVDFDTGKSVRTTYSVEDGREEGFLSEEHRTSYENSNGAGGVPGTASNDSDDTTTYEMQSGTGSGSGETEDLYRLVNQFVEENENTGSDIDFDNSSISVTLTRIEVYTEEELEAQGLLEDMTYEEYRYANQDTVIGTADPELVTLVAMASGIPMDNIHMIVNTVPIYQDVPQTTFDITEYIQIIIFVLIVILLAFVVWRSTRRVEVEEQEPELSIIDLIDQTSITDESVDDIDLQEKSEKRKTIEKFTDENPQAVALLLRNWLETSWD